MYNISYGILRTSRPLSPHQVEGVFWLGKGEPRDWMLWFHRSRTRVCCPLSLPRLGFPYRLGTWPSTKVVIPFTKNLKIQFQNASSCSLFFPCFFLSNLTNPRIPVTYSILKVPKTLIFIIFNHFRWLLGKSPWNEQFINHVKAFTSWHPQYPALKGRIEMTLVTDQSRIPGITPTILCSTTVCSWFIAQIQDSHFVTGSPLLLC